MSDPLASLAEDIVARAQGLPRYVFAIAGPPGAGKSTLADALLLRIAAEVPGQVTLVPMDGYHFDNAVLEDRGLFARKGAPETFDAAALLRDLMAIRAGGQDVSVPVFDRALDLARTSALIVRPSHRIVLVEGNYLLLDQEPWLALRDLFDRTLEIRVRPEILRERLVRRWREHGLDPAASEARAEANDLPNARLVSASSLQADVLWDDSLPLSESRIG